MIQCSKLSMRNVNVNDLPHVAWEHMQFLMNWCIRALTGWKWSMYLMNPLLYMFKCSNVQVFRCSKLSMCNERPNAVEMMDAPDDPTVASNGVTHTHHRSHRSNRTNSSNSSNCTNWSNCTDLQIAEIAQVSQISYGGDWPFLKMWMHSEVKVGRNFIFDIWYIPPLPPYPVWYSKSADIVEPPATLTHIQVQINALIRGRSYIT